MIVANTNEINYESISGLKFYSKCRYQVVSI